jgi:cyclohexyl-isocyanide hydratase
MTHHIGMLIFPRLTQLDFTGPFEVMHRIPGAKVHVIWKDLEPVRADSGLQFLPDTRIDDCPQLDVMVVPGGVGQMELMADVGVLGFLAAQAASAKYVTSVCTGSLLLGAAGLLTGYDATTHWAYTDLLPLFGARFVRKRIVVDRNRVTAGGVTAGIDFGLRIAAELAGDETAKAIQLGLEYDPEPPFRSGHPDVADPVLVERIRSSLTGALAARRAQIVGAGASVRSPAPAR